MLNDPMILADRFTTMDTKLHEDDAAILGGFRVPSWRIDFSVDALARLPRSGHINPRLRPKPEANVEHTMPQTSSRFFDDLSRLMTDAAGLADGARREAQTFAKTQLERMMAGMDLVSREEFEAVREMAAQARDENDKLAARIAALEAKLAEPKPDVSAGS
jgi:BMFP domain-containing protein YqiC